LFGSFYDPRAGLSPNEADSKPLRGHELWILSGLVQTRRKLIMDGLGLIGRGLKAAGDGLEMGRLSDGRGGW